MRREKGFTFVEMLVVVVIIGVIAAISIPAIGSLLNSSDHSEFVNNARSVEEGAHMHYRDNGVMPTQELVSDSDDITEESKRIIKSHLLKAGVDSPGEVLSDLIEGEYIYTVDKDRLREYTRAVNDYEGVDTFVIIDIVDYREDSVSDILEDYYDNELAGYVFSKGTVTDAVGNDYSGSYTMTDGHILYVVGGSISFDGGGPDVEAEVVHDEEDGDLYVCDEGVEIGGGVGSCSPATINGEGSEGVIVGGIGEDQGIALVDDGEIIDIIPYVGISVGNMTFNRFELINFEDNGDGTYDIDLAYDLRLVNLDTNRLVRGYVAQDVSITSSMGNVSESQLNESGTEDHIGKVRISNAVYGDDLVVEGNSNDVYHENLGHLTDATIYGFAEVNYDSNRGSSVDTEDGREIRDGDDYDDRNNLYEKYEERDNFEVEVERGGLRVIGVENRDKIVLKEYDGSVSGGGTKDENRTRLFMKEGTSGEYMIEKDPYLQRDFQENPDSRYEYVIEVYTDELVTTPADRAENAKVVFYD